MCLHFPLSQFVIKPFGKGAEYPVPHSVCEVHSISYAVGIRVGRGRKGVRSRRCSLVNEKGGSSSGVEVSPGVEVVVAGEIVDKS